MSSDAIFGVITSLFDGNVGHPYPSERYGTIYKEGKDRYAREVPPGYEDKSNNPSDTDQFGDLVLWFQLLDFAKSEKRPIILVTDDAKEDWWLKVAGERIGPRPELVAEFLQAGGSSSFYMYSTEQFLTFANEYLLAAVDPAVIKEAEAIEQQNARSETERRRFDPEDYYRAINLAAMPKMSREDYRRSLELLGSLMSVDDGKLEQIRSDIEATNRIPATLQLDEFRATTEVANAMSKLPDHVLDEIRATMATAKSSQDLPEHVANYLRDIIHFSG